MYHRQSRIGAPAYRGSFTSAINLCLWTGLMSSVAFSAGGTAMAQQAVPLRGAVDENVLQTQQNAPRAPVRRAPVVAATPAPSPATAGGIPSDPYEPVSPGALPNDGAGAPPTAGPGEVLSVGEGTGSSRRGFTDLAVEHTGSAKPW